MKKIPFEFYNRQNVVQIAKELLGKILITTFNGTLTSGKIVETEAYAGIHDKASHAFAGRRTQRNEDMYAKAATAYIYVCYGIHHLFNVVTNEAAIPHAILIRALQPVEGIDTMLLRTGKISPDFTLTKGPGNVAKALGINRSHSGTNLMGNAIFLIEGDDAIDQQAIGISKRIGVDYAAKDALLPYRFFIKGNKYVSGRPNK